MRRGAFTLMELLVSVILIALIAMFMYGALGSSRASNRTLQIHTGEQERRLGLYELLYRDCIEAYSISSIPTKSKHFHVLELQTNNSLYDIAAPHVTYFVHAQTGQLIRLESATAILLPIPYEARQRVHADVIIDDVSDFNLYVSGSGTDTPMSDAKIIAFRNQLLNRGNTQLQPAVKPEGREFGTYLLYLNTKQFKAPLLMELAF